MLKKQVGEWKGRSGDAGSGLRVLKRGFREGVSASTGVCRAAL